MKRKIEESLRRAVGDLPGPDWETVSQTPVQRMEVHDYATRQVPATRPNRRRWAAAGALALCALALCAGAGVYLQFFQIYSVVDLRVNPAFAIELNRRDEVRGIEALNDDAAPILEGRSYKGWTLEAAVGALVDELTAKGYLDTSSDTVDVAVNSKSADHGRELREEVEAYITGKLAGLPAPGPAETPVPSPSPTFTPEPVPSTQPATHTPKPEEHHDPSPTPTALTGAAVEALVLARMPEADIRKVELDEDDDRLIYEVKFRDGAGREYEAEFDALTGEVLKWEED